MARNAEILFWTNLPASWLARRARPAPGVHAGAGLWRLARGRPRPFLLGKLDAASGAPSAHGRSGGSGPIWPARRRGPALPLKLGLFDDARNHLLRPREASGRG